MTQQTNHVPDGRKKVVTAVELLHENNIAICEMLLYGKIGDTQYEQLINCFSINLEQAKEMEKQQMIGFAEFVATYRDKNKNLFGEMLHAKSKYDDAERTIDLLKIYYNETYEVEGEI